MAAGKRVLYPGDLWLPRLLCFIYGHHWFGDEGGRHCTRCWRVEERVRNQSAATQGGKP